MDAQGDCFVSGALAAVLRLSRFAGIAPLRFVKMRSGWRVSVSVNLSFYGYCFVTTIILITCGTLISDLRVEQDKSVRMRSNTRRVVFITDACLMMLSAGTAVYGAPGQMRSLIACLNHVQKINYDLNVHHRPTCLERRKICLFILWAITTMTLSCTDHVLLTVMIDNVDSYTWISAMYSFYYGCYWILQMYEMRLIMTILHVLYSFRAINDCLRNLLRKTTISDFNTLPFIEPFNKSLLDINEKYKKCFNKVINSVTVVEKRKSDGVTKSTAQHENVRRLARVFTSACEVVREVDRCHGFMVLLMLGLFILHLVCSPFYVIKNLFEDNISQSKAMYITYMLVELFWCFYHMANLVMVIEPCHLTHMEMEITRELVSDLMSSTQSIYDPLAVELELFFRHLVLNQASYSPMKVTTLTRSLFATASINKHII